MLSVGYLLRGRRPRSRLVLQSALVTDKIADLRATEAPSPPSCRPRSTGCPRWPPCAPPSVLSRPRRQDRLDVLDRFGAEINGLINSLRLSHKADTTTSAGRQIIALDAVLRSDEGVSMVAP